MRTLYIGKDFSDDPSGRFYTDGDGSGEEFREEILRPIIASGKKFKLNIDENVEGYGSSFLVEAFGGLIKFGYFTKAQVEDSFDIDYDDLDFEFYEKKINQYINEALYNSQKYVSTKDEAIAEGRYKELIDKTFVEEFCKG
ncbi:STAS-like domain-containing protein [Alteromonas ponticola]|uniref:STAS-like domain-containing protein n=1 Tax=Alteromonas aquimaris TaxID=2998417 RepID=A0ABT3P6J2_9ALTE|nr:DUF4325 domain-containing protein [Alteromonas aquimaris]MCW8108382.1 STAS-like domain-containing protein [Alteromonas aquimaris]